MSALVGALSIATGAVFLLFCLIAWVRFAPLRPWLITPAVLVLTVGSLAMGAYQVWRGDLENFAVPALFASLGASALAYRLTRRTWAWAALAFSGLFAVLSVLALFLKADRDVIDLALAIFLTGCLTLNLRTTLTTIAARAASDQTPAETGTPA